MISYYPDKCARNFNIYLNYVELTCSCSRKRFTVSLFLIRIHKRMKVRIAHGVYCDRKCENK